MTQQEYKQQFTHGESRIAYLLKKSAFDIIKNDEEMAALINMAVGDEKKELEEIKEIAKNIKHWKEISCTPFITTAPRILMSNILLYAILHDKEFVEDDSNED